MIKLDTINLMRPSFQMEVDARDDLSEAALRDLLHPAPAEPPKQFSRPAPPRGAGPRRITKV